MKKNTTSILLCLFMLFSTTLTAQKIAGIVTSAGIPVAGISVSAKPSNKGAATGKDGRYSLVFEPGTYKITFSGTGFQSITETVTLATGDEKTLDAVLSVATEALQEVIMTTGSRSVPRSSTTSPLPIDNFDNKTLKSTGQISFDKALQYRVPSFNTINTPVNDATTLLDPYEIRNLGPSRTLVLINGKRKNLSSLLYVQFAPGRGETGADLSAIPTDAIKRVEILRDGASAQYGSDAIAGVMNVILKDKFEYSSLTINSGVTSKGDGANYGMAYNSGANFAGKGFINYTVDFSQQNNAVRSGIIDIPTEIATFGGNPTDDASIRSYLAKYPTGNNKNGTGEITAAKFNYNLGIPLGETGMFYSNAALVAKKAISNANFRTPYWRGDPFNLLHTAGSTYNGYGPTFEGDLIDYNATIGFKNESNGWKQDVSFTMGGNQQLYTVSNTLNRGLGANSPISFKPGGYKFTNLIGNYDVSKSVTDNFSIGFGSEIRQETFKIIAGDTASYVAEGANSFPGIRQENATSNSRFNFGGYFDASLDVTKDFLINGTVRVEKYSDFGSAAVWKASSRYKVLGDKLVLRGSISTGFRAPTLHQIYAQSTQASFAGGNIVLSGLFNNRSKQALALGIPLLKPEKSDNYTFGFGFNPTKNFSFTLDFYSITIKERVVYSSSITTDDRLLATPTTELGRILKGNSVGAGNFDLQSVQFFINGIKTKTQGLDVVANYKNINLGQGKLGINLAANFTLKNEIVGLPNDPKAIRDGGSTILSTQIKSLLTEGRPLYKVVLGMDYHVKKFSVNLNNTLFGTTKFQDLDNGGAIMENIKQVFSPAVVTDLNVGYDFTNKINFSVTVNNLLNILPKWKLELTGNSTDPNYANAQATLANAADKSLLEGFLSFSGRYRILGYNGSQFSQLGTIFQASLNFKF